MEAVVAADVMVIFVRRGILDGGCPSPPATPFILAYPMGNDEGGALGGMIGSPISSLTRAASARFIVSNSKIRHKTKNMGTHTKCAPNLQEIDIDIICCVFKHPPKKKAFGLC